jgi:polyhydroxyalkanoate synthesis regulator phasin
MFRAMDASSLVRLLARGGQGFAEGARSEARRVLEVLVERGDLSRAEAEQIEAGVAEAAETQRRWLDERVLGPLGRALRSAGGASDLDSRLAAIEERLARIEAALAKRGGGDA